MLKKILLLLIAQFILSFSFAKKPNIIVFLVDDYGVMDTQVPFIGQKGGVPEMQTLNKMHKTPSMQRLADMGCRFTEFYAMCVCSPTRVSIMTGQNSARHHVTAIVEKRVAWNKHAPKDWRWQGMNADENTLPKMLKNVGYKTIHVGKAHFGAKNTVAADPKIIGFDVNISGSAIGHPGSYYGLKNFAAKNNTQQVPDLEEFWGQDIFLTKALYKKAEKEITKCAKDDQPFFLYFSHYATHAPFEQDNRFIANYQKYLKGVNSAIPPWAKFASIAESMDETLGDTIDLLNKLNIAEDTLIIFLGDNGTDAPYAMRTAMINGKESKEHLNAAPLRNHKGSQYEGGMRTAMIVSWAQPNVDNVNQKRVPIQSGGYRNGITAVYDILPTVLSVVEAPQCDLTDGIDLSPLFTSNDSKDKNREFLMHFPHQYQTSGYYTVYRKGDWKLVYNYITETTELYNLKDDISETNNLSASKKDLVAKMLKGMKAMLKRQNAQMPDLPTAENFLKNA